MKQFFSHVGMESPLPGYYHLLLGSKCVMLKDMSKDRTPTSRSGVRGSTTRPPRIPHKNEMPLSIIETSPYKLHLAYSKNGRDLGLVLNTKKTVNFSIKLHVVAIF